MLGAKELVSLPPLLEPCPTQAGGCIVPATKNYEFPALGKKTSSGRRDGKTVLRVWLEMPDVSAGREVGVDASVLWYICVLVGCVVYGDAPSARRGHAARMGFPPAGRPPCP